MAEPISILAVVVLLATWAIPFGRQVERALHLLQLEEYQTGRYWRWVFANRSAPVDPWLVSAGLAVTVAATFFAFPFWIPVVLGASAVGAWRTRIGGSPPAKKPLVVTA